MNIHIIVSLALTVVCMIHVGILLHEELHPKHPSVKKYEKQLKDIDFPLSFKFCLNHPNLTSYLQSIGYNEIFDFHNGLAVGSKNDSESVYVYGWQGHSNTSSKGYNATSLFS